MCTLLEFTVISLVDFDNTRAIGKLKQYYRSMLLSQAMQPGPLNVKSVAVLVVRITSALFTFSPSALGSKCLMFDQSEFST